MDEELVQILFPGFTAKLDFTVAPPAPLGGTVQWRWTPDFRTEEDGNGSVLRRMATVLVSFSMEMIPN